LFSATKITDSGNNRLNGSIMAPTISIGGVNAPVQYAGSAPGLVNGVIQVNLQVPPGLTSGPQPVVLTFGTAQSQAGITVAVD